MKKIVAFLFLLIGAALLLRGQDYKIIDLESKDSLRKVVILQTKPEVAETVTSTKGRVILYQTVVLKKDSIIDTIRADKRLSDLAIAEIRQKPGRIFKSDVSIEKDENNYGFLLLRHKKTRNESWIEYGYNPHDKLAFFTPRATHYEKDAYDWTLIVSVSVMILIIPLTYLTERRPRKQSKDKVKANKAIELITGILILLWLIAYVVMTVCSGAYFLIVTGGFLIIGWIKKQWEKRQKKIKLQSFTAGKEIAVGDKEGGEKKE